MYAITRKDGHIEREHMHLLDAMDDLKTFGPGFQVRRVIDNAILAWRTKATHTGAGRRKLERANEDNGAVSDWGDRGPRK